MENEKESNKAVLVEQLRQEFDQRMRVTEEKWRREMDEWRAKFEAERDKAKAENAIQLEMTKATNPYVVIPMHGNPQQMEEFSNLVIDSDLETTVTIPSQLEIIIPSQVVPEFGLTSIIVLSSGIGMAIYFLRNKNFIKILNS